MARMGAEQKLVQNTVDTLDSMSFDRFRFARLMTEQDPLVRRRFFHLCMAFIEMYAIVRDYGAFEADEADVMPLVARLRREIVEYCQMLEEEGNPLVYKAGME